MTLPKILFKVELESGTDGNTFIVVVYVIADTFKETEEEIEKHLLNNSLNESHSLRSVQILRTMLNPEIKVYS